MSQQSAQAIPPRESRRIRGLSPSPILSPNPGQIPLSSANSSPLPIPVESPYTSYEYQPSGFSPYYYICTRRYLNSRYYQR